MTIMEDSHWDQNSQRSGITMKTPEDGREYASLNDAGFLRTRFKKTALT